MLFLFGNTGALFVWELVYLPICVELLLLWVSFLIRNWAFFESLLSIQPTSIPAPPTQNFILFLVLGISPLLLISSYLTCITIITSIYITQKPWIIPSSVSSRISKTQFTKSKNPINIDRRNLHACQIYQVLSKLDQEYQANLLQPSKLFPVGKNVKEIQKYINKLRQVSKITSFCSKPSISTSNWCNVFFVWPSHCFLVDPTASISSMKMIQGAYET